MAHVETKVHFFKAGVERDRQTFHTHPVKVECNEGDVATTFVEIEFEPIGKMWGEDGGIDGVLSHDELAPFGGEEGGH